MNLGISFFITSIMLGAGLAMDAFSVSLANGLNEPTMKKSRNETCWQSRNFGRRHTYFDWFGNIHYRYFITKRGVTYDNN